MHVIESSDPIKEYLFIRKEKIKLNIVGMSNEQKMEYIDTIKKMANFLNLELEENINGNFHIVLDDEMFANGNFDEAKALTFGFHPLIIDRLQKNWAKGYGCVFARDHWETTGVGFSIIIADKKLSQLSLKNCIDKNILESFGVRTDKFISCLIDCFQSKIAYNVEYLFRSMSVCAKIVDLDERKKAVGEIFSGCFWSQYLRYGK